MKSENPCALLVLFAWAAILFFLFRLEVAAPSDGAFSDEALHGETLVIDETSEEGQYAVVVRLSGTGCEVHSV